MAGHKSMTQVAQEWWPMPLAGRELEKRLPRPDRSALLVVDMQNTSLSPDHGYVKAVISTAGQDFLAYFLDRAWGIVVPSIKRLLTFFRDHDLTVIHAIMGQKPDVALNPTYALRFGTAEDASGVPLDLSLDAPEQRVVNGLEPLKDELVLVKTTSGVFNSTDLEEILRSTGKDEIYVTGVVTNRCVIMAARGAADRGFTATIVEDGCAAYTPEVHEYVVNDFVTTDGMVLSADAVTQRLGAALSEQQSLAS